MSQKAKRRKLKPFLKVGIWDSAFGHIRRLLRRGVLAREPDRSEIAKWLIEAQYLISKYSTAPRTSEPYKGHASTDSVAWVSDLAKLVANDVARHNRGRYYDGNMALAARLGLILVAWYAHVHRAKSYDPKRPLKYRRAAAAQRTRFLANLAAVLADDSVMGEVWGRKQAWNFPFGRGAKGGKFV